MEIRVPVPDDAPGLGVVHVLAWQREYENGLMPQEFLDGLDPAERETMWANVLQRPPQTERAARFVADDGGIVGFILVGPEEGDEGATRGEVYALNTHPAHWGRGVGRALLARGAEFLVRHFDQAVLWTHRDSTRSRGFYETNGWTFTGEERMMEVLGVEVPEVQYETLLRSIQT